MPAKSFPSCCACGKAGHSAMPGPPPWRAYLCPVAAHPNWWGKTGVRLADGHCSECGGANFAYDNGAHFSVDGVRGYRCVQCGTVKPEADLHS